MSNRGWNRCDVDGRFFSPERDGILIDEVRWLDLHGDLHESWPVYCGKHAEELGFDPPTEEER